MKTATMRCVGWNREVWCVWRRLGSLPSGRPRKEKSATWHVCHSRLMKALVVGGKMQAAVGPTKSSPASVSLGTQRAPRNATRPSTPLPHTGMGGHRPGPRNAAAAAALAQEVEIVHGPRSRRVQRRDPKPNWPIVNRPHTAHRPPTLRNKHASCPPPGSSPAQHRSTEICARVGAGGGGNQHHRIRIWPKI